MVAPTKSFTFIPDGDIDPDSPLTTGLFTSIRDGLENLSSQLIGETSPFTAAQKHDHDGVNSAIVSRATLVFDQTTNNSGSFTNVLADLATITVASADLPTNRDAMIIATGGVEVDGVNNDFTLVLDVDGVTEQTIRAFNVGGIGDRSGFALSEVVNLTSGADRIIKIRGANVGINGKFDNLNLFSVLIT